MTKREKQARIAQRAANRWWRITTTDLPALLADAERRAIALPKEDRPYWRRVAAAYRAKIKAQR